jgi:hypothetical protein
MRHKEMRLLNSTRICSISTTATGRKHVIFSSDPLLFAIIFPTELQHQRYSATLLLTPEKGETDGKSPSNLNPSGWPI